MSPSHLQGSIPGPWLAATGAGFTPARICSIAQPQPRPDPKNLLTGVAAAARGPGFPVKFSRTPAAYDTPAPLPGAHNEEVLARFANLSQAEVRQLKNDGII